MAKGVYRVGNTAFVDFGAWVARVPIARETYEKNGYEPPFEQLPTFERLAGNDAG
jgi:hypothetical protein